MFSNWINKLIKLFFNIFIIIIVVLIVIVMYSNYQTLFLGKKYVNYGGYTFLEVVSGSMSGTIEVNDLVVVKLDTKDVKEGDIITYQSNDELITHRIVKINGDSVITKGDSNNTWDKEFQKSEIIGKVVYVVSGFGIWRKVLFSPKVPFRNILRTYMVCKFFILSRGQTWKSVPQYKDNCNYKFSF